MRVVKATPTSTVTKSPAVVHARHTSTRLTIRLSAPGHRVTGRVSITAGGRTYLARLADGRTRVTLRPFSHTGKHKVAVTYLGSDVDRVVRESLTIRVVR